MGLDGFVRCRCWQDGEVEPPADLAGLVFVDDDGYLDLSVPYEGNEEKHAALARWEAAACSHKDMEFASARVGRWGDLVRSLADLGWQRFPALRAVLPEANGGTAAASACAGALSELDDFMRNTHLGEQALLCDAETGDVIWKGGHGGGNVTARGFVLGVDLDGFFVQRQDTGAELFRAMDFTQEVVDAAVRFTAGARTVALPVDPVSCPSRRHDPPTRLRTTSRRRTTDEFALTVDALRRLFEAAVETGNPVVWC